MNESTQIVDIQCELCDIEACIKVIDEAAWTTVSRGPRNSKCVVWNRCYVVSFTTLQASDYAAGHLGSNDSFSAVWNTFLLPAAAVARDAAKRGQDQKSIVEASCRFVATNRASIRTAIAAKKSRMLVQTIENIRFAVSYLLTYDEHQLESFERIVPMFLLYILFRFDRVVTMSKDEGLSARFTLFVNSLGYTSRYRALYQPTSNATDTLLVYPVHSVHLPRDLVGLVEEYCRLDALAPEDEELIIKRILDYVVSLWCRLVQSWSKVCRMPSVT